MGKQKEKYIDELFSLLDKQAFLIHKTTLEKHHNRELRFDEVVDLEDKINDYISDDDSLLVNDLYKYKPPPFKQVRKEIVSSTTLDDTDGFKHSPDFSWVMLDNHTITLNGNQRKIIKLLYESYKNGEPLMSSSQIEEAMIDMLPENRYYAPTSLYQAFKGNKIAWESLIIRKDKGFYRINLP